MPNRLGARPCAAGRGKCQSEYTRNMREQDCVIHTEVYCEVMSCAAGWSSATRLVPVCCLATIS